MALELCELDIVLLNKVVERLGPLLEDGAVAKQADDAVSPRRRRT